MLGVLVLKPGGRNTFGARFCGRAQRRGRVGRGHDGLHEAAPFHITGTIPRSSEHQFQRQLQPPLAARAGDGSKGSDGSDCRVRRTPGRRIREVVRLSAENRGDLLAEPEALEQRVVEVMRARCAYVRQKPAYVSEREIWSLGENCWVEVRIQPVGNRTALCSRRTVVIRALSVRVDLSVVAAIADRQR